LGQPRTPTVVKPRLFLQASKQLTRPAPELLAGTPTPSHHNRPPQARRLPIVLEQDMQHDPAVPRDDPPSGPAQPLDRPLEPPAAPRNPLAGLMSWLGRGRRRQQTG
jgi:hypothetical protein